jgi:nitrite reductase/ring-hydroxylating ferredoxin subunit
MDATAQSELLERILDHVASGSDPMTSEVMMHPVDRYIRQDHLDLERATLFSDHPLVVGYSDDVRRPGDFFTDELTGRSLLVVRGDDGVLRAFHNICGHRGAKVESAACGNQRRFTCPYHAWSYDGAGRLRGIPNDDGFDTVDRDERSLVEVPVAERHGLVWVRPGGAPGSELDVAAFLGPLDDELGGYRMDGYAHERTDVLRRPFNWKLVVDGFLESYHLRFLHRSTIGPYIKSNFALFDAFGLHGRMVALRSSFDRMIEQPPAERELLPHVAIIYQVFPNTVLVWQGDHFEAWSVFPDGRAPDAMIARASLLAPQHPTTEAEKVHWDKNWRVLMDTVQQEDFVVAQTIHNGYAAGVRSHAVFGRQEATLQHYHSMLEQELDPAADVRHVATVPAPGRLRTSA